MDGKQEMLIEEVIGGTRGLHDVAAEAFRGSTTTAASNSRPVSEVTNAEAEQPRQRHELRVPAFGTSPMTSIRKCPYLVSVVALRGYSASQRAGGYKRTKTTVYLQGQACPQHLLCAGSYGAATNQQKASV
jgi:hypothetical protein